MSFPRLGECQPLSDSALHRNSSCFVGARTAQMASDRRNSGMILRPALKRVRVKYRGPSLFAAVVLVAAAFTGGCDSSSTITTTSPDQVVKCQVSLATPSVVDAGGGAATFSVSTQPECAWNASSAVNWISGLSPASGQGSGNVDFRVAPNDDSSAREGEIVVNDGRVRVSQRAPCRYNVGPPNQSMDAGAGSGGVTVATMSECGWTATTDVGWISLRPPLAGNGNGTVRFVVVSNGASERTGSVIVAGQRSNITQAGADGGVLHLRHLRPPVRRSLRQAARGQPSRYRHRADVDGLRPAMQPGSASPLARAEPETARLGLRWWPTLERSARELSRLAIAHSA